MDALEERREQQRFRLLRQVEPGADGRVFVDGRQLVNFAGNDYLGLSAHPLVKQRAAEYIDKYGVGSTASRLLAGNFSFYDRIERKLARLKGSQCAIILPSGFQTNSTLLSALADADTVVACDRLVHASIVHGLLSLRSRWFRFEHNDLHQLESKLAAKGLEQYGQKWIVTESVFSMDGDVADIAQLKLLADRHQAKLYIDEAHATGVLGQGGMGLCCGIGDDHLVMGTFGKACGSSGAYIACSARMREYIINFCDGLIYSTGLPAPVLGAIDAALDLIPEMSEERRRLLDNADFLRLRLRKLGFQTANSVTQIVPLIVGSDSSALSLATFLEGRGFFVPAIRPPTVPEGAARLRISLTVLHDRKTIESLINSLADWHETET